MTALIDGALAAQRFQATLLDLFAGIALVIAAIGIYGVMAHSLAGRTRELGIRIALGATRGHVRRMLLKEGMTTVGLGLGAGLLGAALASRLITRLLFRVSPTDPLVFASMALTFAAIAALACYLPARRATAAEPMRVLRNE
jgi:ABC-type antimicrobial peptide transport system permease subunit